MSFKSLADLLYDNVAVGTLATEIEKNGIWGWDRYGRFRHFKHDSDEGKRALDLLAAQANYIGDSEHELSPLDDGDLQTISPYDTFGWKESEQPDFHAIEGEEPEQPKRPQAVSKSTNAHLVVIGVLLEFIKGERGFLQKHPSFVSEAALIKAIRQRDPKVPGLGERKVQEKFTQARRMLDWQRTTYQ